MTDFGRLTQALSGRYAIEREVGRGSMATVYLARDIKHHRQVAIKVMRPEISAALGGERFLRDIATAGRLQHPNILMLLDSGEVDDLLYYVMPYVEGESLADRLEREAQLPIEDALQITREVASGLGYAHAQGVIHRDIEPDNIMLMGGHAVVMDFGIGKALEPEAEELTQTGLSVGTPAYMSPEQALAEGDIDGRADVYALGSVLYEMLVGEPPYTGATPQAIMAKRMSDAIPSARRIRETVPLSVDTAIHKSLAQDPEDRFDTAEDFAAALAPGLPSADASSHDRKIGSFTTLLVAVVILVVVSFAAMAGLRSMSSSETTSQPIVLAVLPFENLGAADDEYFAQGMTEEVSDRLARVSGLSVIARTSTARFAGTQQGAREIGDELGAGYLLSGTVRWAKAADGTNRVRISPQLVRVSDEVRVWGEPFDAELTDVFQLQADVAERVAQALEVTLLVSEQRAVRRAPTDNQEAWQAFSLGRYHDARYESAVAIEHFKEAVELDPDFALAYAGLADAYHHVLGRTDRGGVLEEKMDNWARAEQAARRALVLDSTLAAAHVSLAYVQIARDLDWDAAKAGFERGLALDPDYGYGYTRYGFLMLGTGHVDSAVALAQRAVDLDPQNPLYQRDLAMMMINAGRGEEALAAIDRSIALDPALGHSNDVRAGAFMVLEDWDAAAEALKAGGLPDDLVDLWHAAVLDHRQSAAFGAAVEASPLARLLPAPMAFLLATAGENDQVIELLETVVDEKLWPMTMWIKPSPFLDPLRGEPRFQALLERMGV